MIFCWCPEDYRIQVSFDLQGTNYPDEGYKPYSQNWEDVDKQLTRRRTKALVNTCCGKVRTLKRFGNSTNRAI
ncbi:MAG: hypothetical protein ACLUE2_01530 [Bacteroides cellulosilyticus]